MLETIGRYRIVRQLGEGGMGIVFEAHDDRLDRSVAVKTIRQTGDAEAHERFLREARAAAAVSHPNVCQIFEIGEHDGMPFLVMELLDGRSLADRLIEGPLLVNDAIDLMLPVLWALEALHRRGVIHRDLKPSNIFLSSYGVKLVDFGLARPISADMDDTTLTRPGIVLGTPRYMAPEQVRSAAIDTRADIFAAGAVLFEMLSGRPAFQGSSGMEVFHAVLHDHPPALVGSLAIAEVDRIIHRALAKSPDDRYPSCDTMAEELRSCRSRGESTTAATTAHATTRLIVLPFRPLRPDSETDFLAFSLADAITVALSGLESLIIRSTHMAAPYATTDVDLRSLSSATAVDAVVMGTLLRAGSELRVTVQLVEAPAGTLLWSQVMQVPVLDLFQVQDRVAHAVVEALSVPISSQERGLLQRDVPASPEAYGLYLRANRLIDSSSHWDQARELYNEAVALDPRYAPAWARLGRCLRMLGKYGGDPEADKYIAESAAAFRRAFELNPDLSLAHNLYTYAEVDDGRAKDAMVRLLERLRHRSSDPELYAGLVHACRYCGVLDASIAADAHARRLDPGLQTTVAHSYFLQGNYEAAIARDTDHPPYLTMLLLLLS
jgi:non-specific serine/threonine protein kinase